MVQAFFKRYAAAFVKHDPALISHAYDFPMTFYTSDGVAHNFDQEKFEQNSTNLLSLYADLGVNDVSFDILSNIEINSALSLISILWQFNDAEQNKIYTATTRYLLKNIKDDLKIQAVFVVDETQKWHKLRNA